MLSSCLAVRRVAGGWQVTSCSMPNAECRMPHRCGAPLRKRCAMRIRALCSAPFSSQLWQGLPARRTCVLREPNRPPLRSGPGGGLSRSVCCICQKHQPGKFRRIRSGDFVDVSRCGHGNNRTPLPTVLGRQRGGHRKHKPGSRRYRFCPWPTPARWWCCHGCTRQRTHARPSD